MDQPDLSLELAFAHELADVAAKVTLLRFGDRLAVTRKGDGTSVTDADVAAERAMREALAATFPRDGMQGEETGRIEGSSGRTWVIDPIDGTAHYADGVPLWTTLIGLDVDGHPALGVADVPALGMRYHASRGGGAWCGDRSLRTSRVEDLADAFIMHSAVERWAEGGRIDDLVRILGAARRSRGLSDAWAQMLIAQGSADALLENEPCFEWDWTATSVIVEEAGGRLTTLDGGPPAAGASLLVSNGTLHDETLAALRPGVDA
ncbi:MAG TPA: inositol monophosphatase family protein [Actinomycetota bacterium]|nr:inositol monophosphatase family protein [Actinomycetota bacterium]